MIASTATAIWSAASWLASGSMSDEFSGQMTNNGCGARPARTSSDSLIVSRTWLSSTARRWALKSSPSCGTLPCTAATLTDGSSAAPAPECRTAGEIAAVAISTRQMQAPGSTTAGGAESAVCRRRRAATNRRSRRPARQGRIRAGSPRTTPAARRRSVPVAAAGHRFDRNRLRPRGIRRTAPSTWPTRPAPRGRRTRSAIRSTCASRQRPGRTSAGNTACRSASASQGRSPTMTPVHGSSGMLNAAPNRKP